MVKVSGMLKLFSLAEANFSRNRNTNPSKWHGWPSVVSIQFISNAAHTNPCHHVATSQFRESSQPFIPMDSIIVCINISVGKF